MPIFLFYCAGYDLIEWLMERLSIDDSGKKEMLLPFGHYLN